MPEWESPKWRRQGRTGSGPFAPRYARRSDRRAVRKGDGCLIWVATVGAGMAAAMGAIVDRLT
jgi:hypothetical protein